MISKDLQRSLSSAFESPNMMIPENNSKASTKPNHSEKVFFTIVVRIPNGEGGLILGKDVLKLCEIHREVVANALEAAVELSNLRE